MLQKKRSVRVVDLNELGFLSEASGEENSRIFNQAAENGGTKNRCSSNPF